MKNKTKKRLGIVAAMLGVVVAIGATAGTTLAKYISSATVNSQTATVAAWGFTVTTNAADLFGQKYNNGKIVKADDTTSSIDVKAEHKVVAPGTSSNGAIAKDGSEAGQLTFTINGSAEVDAHLVIDISDFDTVWLDTNKVAADTESKKLGTDIYYPLKWTLTAGGKKAALNLTYNATKGFNEQLAESIVNSLKWGAANNENALPTGATVSDKSAGSQVVIAIPAGTKLENYVLTLAWEWPFEQNKDVEDTVLGWLADGKVTSGTSYDSVTKKDVTITGINTLKEDTTAYNLTVKIGCKVQVVQVQTKDQNPAF